MPIADARPRAAPAMDRRLPRSLIDWAKKSIRALKALATPANPRTQRQSTTTYDYPGLLPSRSCRIDQPRRLHGALDGGGIVEVIPALTSLPPSRAR